ncbi:ppsC [Symbiodinium pilosum]|uniref:PpsC protein n=1 Tax=Symbiodinium pilosum TaxID=2952 RepID=A0A812KQQ7_SYMPI|nr:ppsC [Symbiodinium pilosum]
MALIPGTLVDISGLPGKAEPVPSAAADGVEAVDLNGTSAQLVQYDKAAKKWIAATFSGRMIAIDQKNIRPVQSEAVQKYDFVLGPKSDYEISGQEITRALATKGYALVKLIVAEEDAAEMVSVAQQLDDNEQFSRLAIEFERGYLGDEGNAKTVHVGLDASDTPDFIKRSPLKTMDNNFGQLCSMLSKYSEENLGFEVYSRTEMLLRMPLADGEEDKYPPADIDDGDAEGFLHLMYRRRLTVLQFVGPAGGSLKLLPVKEGDQEIDLAADPHTMLVMLNSRWEYSYSPAGKALALQTFMLAEPAIYCLEDEVQGNVENLTGQSTGPPPPPGEHCTIESMYCRYGMQADGRHQFWQGAAKACCDGLTEVPVTRWDHGPYFDPESQFGGAYTRHGCFGIEGVDLFDCKFFEISPMEAKGMDPCQRQVMEVSYMALLEGGYDKRSLQREAQNIGHFVGIDKDDWMCMSAAGMLDCGGGAHGAAAAANAITSNRFSYSMNLKGASMTIDTACSSSLVCTHVSKLHLRFKDYEPMPASIVNGLNLMLYPGPFVGCCAAGMLSHDGRCFTFNSTADGYARGELCGALCFKLKQFDPSTGSICCLAGSQSNQDGRSASLTAPNGPAQEKCIKAVLRECKLTPTEVDCIECHGTGTALGDPIEVGSFKKVMSATPRKEPLVITSSKSNIAHGEGGAGLAGFFKCCLQVSNCEGASNVHLKVRNPHLDMEGFPCQILSESVAMREDAAYSGVSSFGFGGTNAHAEAWGKNIMNSRGCMVSDPIKLFERKLAKAPPAEITMNGDDVRDWETTGLDPAGQIGDRYMIELDEDGVATWEKVDEELVDWGDDFSLQGTFNNWEAEPMERSDSILGLWVGEITVGSTGAEHFQVIADNDDEKVYCPDRPNCTSKVAQVQGPKTAAKEKSWVIRGAPGDKFKIEFFQQEKRRSVLWMKL